MRCNKTIGLVWIPILTVLLLPALPAAAHDVADHPYLVIDTDAGLDDVVALTLALQHPDVAVSAVVMTPGASGRTSGIEALEALLHRMNRSDVLLFGGAARADQFPAPAFRETAEGHVKSILPGPAPRIRREFTPEAFVREGVKTTVLIFGPLTSFAAALEGKPEIADMIEEVIVAGSGDPLENINLAIDKEAWKAVVASGLPLEYVEPGPIEGKPAEWADRPFRPGPGTSAGEAFLREMFDNEKVRRHYLGGLDKLCDELTFIYYADSSAFEETEKKGVFRAKDAEAVLTTFTRFAARGRQGKRRVILTDGLLPDGALQEDVRTRRDSILRRHGEDEWFAQLLMNELHEHLGAYSVVGVKMGIRAAEILNAPPHSMEIVSHSGPLPPFSCLNDGLLVATGSTPGRGLFVHEPGDPKDVSATFTLNGRSVTLRLKPAYRLKVKSVIGHLVEAYGLERPEYWAGVRTFGLDIWESWHRLEIFEVERSN